LIAKSVVIEAIRRREIYAIVLVSLVLIGAVMALDFFQLEGLNKFYREVALKVMGIATALTVIVLSARQLPREFEQRTIYPLLAKPVSRLAFLSGKLIGVMLAATFCFALFMAVYVVGTLYMGGSVPWMLFVQHIYLQTIMLVILAALGFWLSMTLNFDAAVTIGVLFYATASLVASFTSYLYDYMSAAGQWMLTAMVIVIPQLSLFDLTAKAVHGESWDPLALSTLLQLTVYGGVFALLYFSCAAVCFRRRAL
jgi:ABC-type transport system involved in multi-copper enzyme maturation permease subunit